MSLANKQNIKSLYIWMLIPFLVMQIGIFPDYWPSFTRKGWGTHIHYFTASAWFVFLIMQPYLIKQGNVNKHRTNGMIGFFIAGGVIFSALALYPNDVRTAIEWEAENFNIGYLTANSFTSLLVAESVLIIAYAYAIIKSIMERKNVEEHAWWLMCSIYFIMMPTVGRGMFYVAEFFVGGEDAVKAWHVELPTTIVISGMAMIMIQHFKKWKHPASWLAIFMTPLSYLIWYILTRMESVHRFIIRMIVLD